ncbi:MAG TPA: hypothetical protein VGS62_08525 [Streptosporangiaceae bacterium]|nr:hypothetical protein [Streptosporangiaceae bacterium]
MANTTETPAGQPAGEGYQPAPDAPEEPEDLAGQPLPPVVADTPALRGYPGGPGLEIPGSGQAAGESHHLSTPSSWQDAQRVWRAAGVDWQRTVPGWETAEPGWDRVGPSRPGRLRASVRFRRPARLREASGLPQADRLRAGSSAGRFRVRRRVWQAVVAGLLLLALAVAAVLVSRGSGGKAAGSGPRYPAAQLAGAAFATDPTVAGRGIFQPVSGVAAWAGTIVAAGSETGEWIPRAQFFVSVDGGGHWRLAPVLAAGGAEPPPGHAPRLIAGGPPLPGGRGGWLALGSGATWTSRDGRSWLLAAGSGIGPLQSGDRVNALARTGSGFIAVGSAATGPVIWISPDGLSWQRLAGPGLRLATAPAGRVLGLTAVAAHGSDVIVQGVIARTGRYRHRGTGPRIWQSGDDGASWTPARLPAGAIDGVAATNSEFVLIRPIGPIRPSRPGAVAYTSTAGLTWSRAGTITAARSANLRVVAVGGSDQGVVVSGQVSGGATVAYTSPDGRSWHSVANLASPGGSLAGLTVTTGGTVVAAGATASRPEGQQPYLVLAGAHASAVSFARISGATGPALTIGGMATAARRLVAVGSANGFPAIWAATRGRWTRVSSAALTRPGLATLADVTHGPAGWLAVGEVLAGASPHPIVVTSPDAARWQAADAESAFSGSGISVSAAAAGRSGYVIVGRQVIPARTVSKTTVVNGRQKSTSQLIPAHNIAAAWWSPGLSGWSRAGDATAGDLDGPGVRQLLAVAAGGPGFVAAGSVNNAPAVWTSADGKRWALTGLPVPADASSAVLSRVAATGRLIVATGLESGSGGPAPFAEYSPDGGTTWHQARLTAPGGGASVTGLVAAGRGFTAVGTAGPPGNQRVVVWTSRDGAAWQATRPAGFGLSGRGSQAITALAASGSSITGAGYVATPAGEHATLWQVRIPAAPR